MTEELQDRSDHNSDQLRDDPSCYQPRLSNRHWDCMVLLSWSVPKSFVLADKSCVNPPVMDEDQLVEEPKPRIFQYADVRLSLVASSQSLPGRTRWEPELRARGAHLYLNANSHLSIWMNGERTVYSDSHGRRKKWFPSRDSEYIENHLELGTSVCSHRNLRAERLLGVLFIHISA